MSRSRTLFQSSGIWGPLRTPALALHCSRMAGFPWKNTTISIKLCRYGAHKGWYPTDVTSAPTNGLHLSSWLVPTKATARAKITQRNAQPWGTWHLLMPPRNLSNELWPSRHMYCHGLSVHCPPQTVVFRHLDPSWFPIWKVKQLNKEGRENSRFQSLGQGGWGGTGQRQQSFRDPACKKYPTLWTVFKCLWNLFKFTIVLCHLGA